MLAPSHASPWGWEATGIVCSITPPHAGLAESFEIVLLSRFATQTLAPSKASPLGPSPTPNVPSPEPSLIIKRVTEALFELLTHTLIPSEITERGPLPTKNVPSTAPVLAFSFVTVLLPEFATHIVLLMKSHATPMGLRPTGYVPITVPVDAWILVTELPPQFAAQMLPPPSAAIPVGLGPTPIWASILTAVVKT